MPKLIIPFQSELIRDLSLCRIPRIFSLSKLRMSEIVDEAAAERTNLAKVEDADSLSREDTIDANNFEETQIPLQQQEEETIIKKKYGGLLPKKPPLISKDNERAFFDSADWALGKVGAQKSKGPLEALRPKLQPTQNQQLRSRSAYARGDDDEDGCESDSLNTGENHGDVTESLTNQSSENQNLEK